MARRDFRRGAAAVRSSRLTTWFQFSPVATTLATNSATALVFSLNAAALALRPFTVVRTHWEIFLMSDQAASQEQQTVGVGIAVVSDQAVGVGVSAVPTPVLEAGSSMWFLHQYLYADESSLVDNPKPGARVSIDSKAMRKVEVGQDIVVVVEGGGIFGGMSVRQSGRMLIKNN